MAGSLPATTCTRTEPVEVYCAVCNCLCRGLLELAFRGRRRSSATVGCEDRILHRAAESASRDGGGVFEHVNVGSGVSVANGGNERRRIDQLLEDRLASASRSWFGVGADPSSQLMTGVVQARTAASPGCRETLRRRWLHDLEVMNSVYGEENHYDGKRERSCGVTGYGSWRSNG